jgi:hypothetical protein
MFFSNLTAYDYKYNGLSFTAAFPVSKKDIVTARYIFVGLIFLCCTTLLLIIRAVNLVIQGQELTVLNSINYEQTGILFINFSLFFGTVIPLYFKLGYQKVRWFMFIAVFIVAVVSSVIMEKLPNLNQPVFVVIAAIAGFIIYLFSLNLSVRFLENNRL